MPPQSSPTTSSAVQPTRSSTSGSGGLSSPAGSPPLILAFLAIGIFSAAMIAVFGWRRVQFPREGRGFVHDGFERRFNARNGSNAGSGASSRFGEKPVLWELRTDRKTKVDAVDYGTWDNIMPLAVAPVSHGPSSPRRQDSSSDTRSQTRAPVGVITTSPLSGPMLIYSLLGPPRPWATSDNDTPSSPSSDNQRSFSSRPRRQQSNSTPIRAHTPTPLSLLWRHRRRAGGRDQGNPDGPMRLGVIGHEGSGGEDVRTETRHEENGRKEIQVAVIIEMPSLAASALRQRQWRRSFYSSSLDQSDMRADMEEEGEEKEGDQGELQYCIGVHAGPWPVAGAPGAKDTTTASVGNSPPERIASPGDEK